MTQRLQSSTYMVRSTRRQSAADTTPETCATPLIS